MVRSEVGTATAEEYVYVATVTTSRPVNDFTPRLVPFHAGAAVPLEAPFIVWYR